MGPTMFAVAGGIWIPQWVHCLMLSGPAKTRWNVPFMFKGLLHVDAKNAKGPFSLDCFYATIFFYCTQINVTTTTDIKCRQMRVGGL